jgi:hypothetical protein
MTDDERENVDQTYRHRVHPVVDVATKATWTQIQ